MDEEQLLLDKLGRGDVDALDTLYVRYAPKVYDFSLRFLKNEAEAEDVTQDIFLQVWDNRSLMGQVVSIRAYLFRMTRNTIFNRFKRSKMHLQYIRQSETREAELSVDPGRRITTEDLLEMIELAIENLPEQCRRVFKMSRYEHLSYNEIAERLGISPHPCNSIFRRRCRGSENSCPPCCFLSDSNRVFYLNPNQQIVKS